MSDIIFFSRLVLSIINIGVLGFLIIIFLNRYSKVKSEFTLGFLLFSTALFFRTVLSSPIVRFLILNDPHHTIIDPYRLIADVFEIIALGIFLYISTR